VIPGTGPTRRQVARAGHVGDVDIARRALDSDEPVVRATALGALQRLGELTDETLAAAIDDSSATVRRRSAEIAAAHAGIDLLPLLYDTDPAVVEMAAWAAGEHGSSRDEILQRIVDLAAEADDPLVREAAVAALGAIGSEHGRAAILRALSDKPAIRRRAVLALAPFDGPEVDAAIERSLEDRDWQVRQAAEDLRRAMR